MCSVNSPSEPIWIEKSEVMAMHARQLAEHGGGMGVRDEALLESALARPQQLFFYGSPHPSLFQLAAAYAYGIAKHHAFVDGNKRTTLVVCETFLVLNGTRIVADALERYKIFYGLAAGTVSEEQLATWLKDHAS